MDCASLITGIRKYFRYSLKHSEIFISDNQADSSQATFLKTYKEGAPALFIFFHTFSCTDDLTAAIITDTNGNKNRNVLDFTTPAVFQIDAINIEI